MKLVIRGLIVLALLTLFGLPSADAVQLRDRCRMSTATTGTGTITLGSAISGFQTFAGCGVTDGQVVRYCIDDPGATWPPTSYETGSGTYTSSGTTLSRTVSESSNSDTAINLSGSAHVSICDLTVDLPSETTPTDTTIDPTTAHAFVLEGGVLKRALINDIIPMDVGQLYGLTLSNNAGDATNDIGIAIGEARDRTDAQDIKLLSALIKRIDASFTAGTNQGCMNTGAVADNTWYEIHLILDTAGPTVDVMCTTTDNRATLPTGYDNQRQIGWVRRGSATNLAFTQIDDYFTLTTQINDVAAAMTLTAAAVTLTVPPSTIARFRAGLTGDSTFASDSDLTTVFSEIVEGNVTPASSTGIASLSCSSGDGTAGSNQCEAGGHFELRVSSTSTIEHDSASAEGSAFDISTYGWIDHRGKLSQQ